MTRSAADIRQDFIDFFTERGHTFVPGSPVVPYDDPTLLFTNAGMNQFKDVFLATGTRSYNRAVDSQPCIRAGGKHNDLDDVGQDTYHHTFFEMLGNWSFGDYFKKEAIEWAWELLTKVWGLDKTRLHATYFEGYAAEGLEPDNEAKELWAAVTDIDPKHIHPGNKKDNFWEMGETGPCGPCSEIHIDLTPDNSGSKLVNAGDARVIEIWNLVFIQFNRDASGKLTPLPAKHVDTGMGFERVTALLQGKSSNYDTDVFTPIFEAIRDITGAPPYAGTLPGVGQRSSLSNGGPPPGEGQRPSLPNDGPHPEGGQRSSLSSGGTPPGGGQRFSLSSDADKTRSTANRRSDEGQRESLPSPEQAMIDVSYRVIADHARCLTFAINDGCVPDREGRGYVLRRILRRGVRYGWQYFNMHEPFLYKLVPTVVATLGDAFPQLKQKPEQIAEIIREEEESFCRTLDRGIALFERELVWAVTAAVEQANPGCEVRLGYPTALAADPDILSIDHLGTGHTLGIDVAELKQTGARHPKLREFVKSVPTIPAEVAFKLHDTYGFPIDVTQVMAEEKGLKVDIAEYERLMEEARHRARAGTSLNESWLDEGAHEIDESTEFVGYAKLELEDAVVMRVLRDDRTESIDGLTAGETGCVILDRTPFYAEAGGQVGDKGVIVGSGAEDFEFRVEGTRRVAQASVHLGTCVRGRVRPSSSGIAVGGRNAGDDLPDAEAPHWVYCVAKVDPSRRATMQNHTATHVMNWALREVLGDHVQQKGSLVDPDKTRFDLSHPRAVTAEEIERVESLVNGKIGQKLTVYDRPVEQEQALRIHGLRAVFGEKYPDVVRVMSIGTPVEQLVANPGDPEWRNVSIEFCGGTHCQNTGQIGHFAIVSEEAVAKGIRRVVGITGEAAQAAIERGAELLKRAEMLRGIDRPEAGPPDADRSETGPTDVAAGGSPAGVDLATQVAELQQAVADATLRVVDRAKLRDAFAELQKIVRKQQKRAAAVVQDAVTDQINGLLAGAPKVGETTVFVAEMPDVPIDQLKTGADMIKQKCGSAAVLFGVRVEATERRSDEATKATAPGAPPKSERAAPASAKPAQGKALLLAAMSNDLVKRGIKAGDLIKQIAKLINGGGGGPPTMAQAGGKDPSKIPDALAEGRKWIEDKLGQ